MKGRDFVLICNPGWELKIGSNIRNIAIEIAKNNRVLYVNPPLDRKTALFHSKDIDVQKKLNVFRGKEEDLTKVGENLWLLEPAMMAESINWIPFTPAFKLLNAFNSKKFAKEIRSAMDRLAFKNVILLNDSLMFRGFDLPELLDLELHIYYIRDYLISQPYFKRHGVQMEGELMRKSDMVVANSVFLANFSKQFNANSFYIGQGYEGAMFNYEMEYEKPEELKSIDKPIVGYVGTLTSLRLDDKLLMDLATQLTDFEFVFIGPEDDVFKASKLHDLPNVRFLGLKPMKELAAYVKYFDVCINPQLVNDLTIGNYPLKIDEYLSMGKPTVATNTEAMQAFSEYTYLADGLEEYSSKIKQAFKENTKEKEVRRVAFSKDHSWENCISELYRRIEAFNQGNNSQ